MGLFISRFASVLLLLSLASCSWIGGLFDSEDEEVKRDPFPLTKIESEVDLKTLWSIRVGQDNEDNYQRLVPAVDGGRIFAAGTDGRVFALEPAKGKKIWETDIRDVFTGSRSDGFFAFGKDKKDVISGGVGVGNDLVMVASSSGHVIALNQSDGSLAWKAEVSSEVLAPPQVNTEIAIAQSIDGKVVGLDPLDGTKRWTFSTSVPGLTLRGTSTPILLQDQLITAFANGRVMLLNTSQGLAHWEQRVAVGQGQSELERLVDIDGTMVLQGSRLFVVSYQGRLIAVDVTKGEVVWQHTASSFAGLGAGFGQVYLAAEDSVLTAYNMDTSKEIWKVEALTYRDITSPVDFGNYIAVGDAEGYIHLIAQSDGRFVGRKKVDGRGIRSTMLALDDRLYVMGNSGKLTALAVD